MVKGRSKPVESQWSRVESRKSRKKSKTRNQEQGTRNCILWTGCWFGFTGLEADSKTTAFFWALLYNGQGDRERGRQGDKFTHFLLDKCFAFTFSPILCIPHSLSKKHTNTTSKFLNPCYLFLLSSVLPFLRSPCSVVPDIEVAVASYRADVFRDLAI